MIYVIYPPTLTRNFEGEIDIVPSFFNELYIDEGFAKDFDILTAIKDVSLEILQKHKYSSIINFMIHQIDENMANIHFQILKYAIDMDRMEPDYRTVSYFGTIYFSQVDGSVSDKLS